MSAPTMTKDQIEQYVGSLDDTDLLAKLQQASDDLADAAQNQSNSEWHSACFAVCYVCAQEANRRGFRL